MSYEEDSDLMTGHAFSATDGADDMDDLDAPLDDAIPSSLDFDEEEMDPEKDH